jgi:hypothetical protein
MLQQQGPAPSNASTTGVPVSFLLRGLLDVLSLFGAGSTASQIESRRLAKEGRLSMRQSLKAHLAHIQGWKSTAVGNTSQNAGRIAPSKRNAAVGLAPKRTSTTATHLSVEISFRRRRRSTAHTAGPGGGGPQGALPPVPTDLPPNVSPPSSAGVAANATLPASSSSGMASSSVWIPCVSLPPSCKVSIESLFNRHSVGYVDGYIRSRAEVDEGLHMCAAPITIPPPVGGS